MKPETLEARIAMARSKHGAPTECSGCGAPNFVRRFSGGNVSRTKYRESGEVECTECGHRESWNLTVGGPVPAEARRP